MVDEFGLHQRKKCEEIKDKCILDEKDGQSLVKYLIPGKMNQKTGMVSMMNIEMWDYMHPFKCIFIHVSVRSSIYACTCRVSNDRRSE